jgi:hypothetical protein
VARARVADPYKTALVNRGRQHGMTPWSLLLILSASVLAIVPACSTTPPPAKDPPATPPPAAQPSEVVTEVSSLRFTSAFWPNLHHVLYAEAWARRGQGGRPLAGELPGRPLADELRGAERGAWDAAVAYYDDEVASKDLLFDPDSARIRSALVAAHDDAPPDGLAPAHRAHLAAVAPVYRARRWPAHDRHNRDWISAAAPHVAALSPAVPDRLARLYGTPWFTRTVRVDVVVVANRQGAYTSRTPAPAHITVSSSDPHYAGWASAEMIFHEASHGLVRPVMEAFATETRARDKSLPTLWHAALFYLTGEVVRQELARRGTTYTPYLYATGLLERAWPRLREPLETHWRPYVDAQAPLEEAVRNVVAACPDR